MVEILKDPYVKAFLTRLQTAEELRASIRKALKHLDNAPLQHRNGPIYQAAGELRTALGLPPSEIGERFSKNTTRDEA